MLIQNMNEQIFLNTGTRISNISTTELQLAKVENQNTSALWVESEDKWQNVGYRISGVAHFSRVDGPEALPSGGERGGGASDCDSSSDINTDTDWGSYSET